MVNTKMLLEEEAELRGVRNCGSPAGASDRP
jgi:hypothetical protein